MLAYRLASCDAGLLGVLSMALEQGADAWGRGIRAQVDSLTEGNPLLAVVDTLNMKRRRSSLCSRRLHPANAAAGIFTLLTPSRISKGAQAQFHMQSVVGGDMQLYLEYHL